MTTLALIVSFSPRAASLVLWTTIIGGRQFQEECDQMKQGVVRMINKSEKYSFYPLFKIINNILLLRLLSSFFAFGQCLIVAWHFIVEVTLR